MDITFSKADITYLDKIDSLYNNCKRELLKNNILQWGKWDSNYPGREFLNDAIVQEELFILKYNGEIIGAVVLNENQSREWKTVNWSKIDGKTLVIHALVIDPKQQNRGFGKKLLSLCEQYAKDNGYSCIRLDSFKKNNVSNRLYQSFGYKNVGTVVFNAKPEKNKEYYCYEKILQLLNL
jgi:ribosomal protein S18 acetylase RimI-like enzyme